MRFNLSDEISIEVKTLHGVTMVQVWSEYKENDTLKHKLIIFNVEEWTKFIELSSLIDEYVKKEIAE